jgi:hypothetical protein
MQYLPLLISAGGVPVPYLLNCRLGRGGVEEIMQHEWFTGEHGFAVLSLVVVAQSRWGLPLRRNGHSGRWNLCVLVYWLAAKLNLLLGLTCARTNYHRRPGLAIAALFPRSAHTEGLQQDETHAGGAAGHA